MKKILFLLTLLITASIVSYAQEDDDEEYDKIFWVAVAPEGTYPDANGIYTEGEVTASMSKYIGLEDGRFIYDGGKYGLRYCLTLPSPIKSIYPYLYQSFVYEVICSNGCIYEVHPITCEYRLISCFKDGGIWFKHVIPFDNGTTYAATSLGDIYSLEGPNATEWKKKGSVSGYPTALGASGNTVLVTAENKNEYSSYLSTDGGASFSKIDMGTINHWIGTIIENPAKAGSFFFGGSNGTLAECLVANNNGVHTIQWNIFDSHTNLGINDGIGSRFFSIQNSNSSASFNKPTLKSATFKEEEKDTITAIFVGDDGLYLFAKSDGTFTEPKQIPDCEDLKGVEAVYTETVDTINPTTLKKCIALEAYAWGSTSLWHYYEVVDSAYYQLAVSDSVIEIPDSESTNTFDITSNVNWQVTTNHGWLTIEPVSGSGDATVTFVAGANPTFDARTDTLTITGDEGLVQTIVVTQAKAVPFLTASVESLTLAGSGGNENGSTFDVSSNISWGVSSNKSWLTVSPISGSGNGTINVIAEANSTIAERTAIITVSADNVASQTITVTQDAGAANLTLSPSTLEIEDTEGSMATFDVVSNTTWEAISDQSWLSVSPANGTGNGTITVTAEANPTAATRSATVTVSGTGVASQTVVITQSAGTAALSVSPLSLDVAASEGSSSTFTITSNIGWVVLSNETWLKVSKPFGNGNSEVMVIAEANPTAGERTGTIVVSATGAGTQTVTVTQAAGAATLTVAPLTIDIVATGGDTVIVITSNTSWAVATDQEWLSVSPANGTNNGTVSITAGVNNTGSSLTATITVSSDGATSQMVTITQPSTVSVHEDKVEEFELYPNPFADGFYVKTVNEETTVSIFNINGRLLFLVPVSGNAYIPASTLRQGIYFVELKNPKNTFRVKVVKR